MIKERLSRSSVIFRCTTSVRLGDLGWSEIENGELLTLAEQSGFELLITTDTNLKYQQNLVQRRISVVVLLSTDWQLIEPQVFQVIQAIERVVVGSYEEISIRKIS